MIESKAQDIYSVSGYQIEVTAKRVRQRFKRILRNAETGITIDQWVLLQELSRNDGSSQLHLAQAVYKDPPTVTRIIDLLVDRDLVSRKMDKNDRRRFSIYLTAAGKQKIKAITPLVDTFRKEAFQGISKTKLSAFKDTLDTIFRNLA